MDVFRSDGEWLYIRQDGFIQYNDNVDGHTMTIDQFYRWASQMLAYGEVSTYGRERIFAIRDYLVKAGVGHDYIV